MASGAPYGYLSTLYDRDWVLRTYFAWRDDAVIQDIIVQGYKTWEAVVALNPDREL
jgi:hypothetical protein